MFWGCWSDQHTQIYQTISMQSIAKFLSNTRLWGLNSNEGHNGTSRLRYVWVWESRRAGLEVLRPPLRQIRPNCCTGSVVCTTRLSIPKCQSNTHHQPTNPMNPTLISRHLSRRTKSQVKEHKSQRNIFVILTCVWFWKYFTCLNFVNIWRSLDVPAILIQICKI